MASSSGKVTQNVGLRTLSRHSRMAVLGVERFLDAKASRPAQKVGATSVAKFPQARSRIRQGEDRARRGDAAQLMFAERHQRRAGLGSDRTRDQHGVAERPAQSLEPADEVDRGADGGEIEPVGGADIAPQDFAEM